MKAIAFRILYVVVAALIILLVSFGFLNLAKGAFETGSLEALRNLTAYRSYSFDINDLLSNDPNAINSTNQTNYYTLGSDPQFCKDLRNCIEMNLKIGQQCVISYKVKPNTPFNPDNVASAISSCPSTDVKEELSSGTSRKMCKFDTNLFTTFGDYNKIMENDTLINGYEPYIHNCYLPEELGANNIQNSVDQLNYIYSGRGTTSGYDFKNGGKVRMVVTNVSIKNDIYATCSYSLYVCGQNAIAASESETPVKVFKIIQNLDERELYFNEEIVWADPAWKFLEEPYLNNMYGYYPRPYEFTFSGTCGSNCREALIDAADAGMWEWNKIHFYDQKAMKYFLDYDPSINNISFSYSPIVKVFETSNINFGSECWNTAFEKINAYGRLAFTGTEGLEHSFDFGQGTQFINNPPLRMVLGIKKIFSSTSYVPLSSPVKLVMDPITFCSESNSYPPQQPCVNYNDPNSCTYSGCRWCSKCYGYYLSDPAKQGKCVGTTSSVTADCGLTCGDTHIPVECNAGSCPTGYRWYGSSCNCLPTVNYGCLKQGSLVLTPNGFEGIEDLKEGDYVIGYKDGKTVKSKVLEKSEHTGKFNMYLYRGYWFTENHLVYLDGYKEFKLVTKLSNITKYYEGKIYNIQTETKNYFGENGLLIHNK